MADNNTLSALQICNKIKANLNTRKYIEHKYKNTVQTESEWKKAFKKDKLTF